jgi:hypothetical protein
MANIFMETLMQTLLSGLSEQASRAYLGTSFDDMYSLQWKPAAQFMTHTDSSGAGAMHQRVWLYRAPWAWLADGSTANPAGALQQWQAEQRAVLQLRRTLRQRIILVNIDRVPVQALFERLGMTYRDQPIHLPDDPLAVTLGSLFEQMAPECWTLYEALEAGAWLPSGEPEFRSNRPLPTSAGLFELLELVQAGRQQPFTLLQLHERETTINSLRRESEHMRAPQLGRQGESDKAVAQLQLTQQALLEREAESQLLREQHASLKQQLAHALADQKHALQAIKTADTGNESAVEENQLLLSQLHQVQEELEKRHMEAHVLNEKHIKLQKELDQALATQQQSGKDLAGATAKAQALSEENEMLLSQLHLVQEELENYYLANREILAAMDQSNHTLHRARKVISQVAAHV